MDFAIALLLFTFTLVVYFSYTNNVQKQDKGELDLMIKDAKAISNSLALEGYPDDWNNATVVRIGISDEQQLNATKLKTLKQLNYALAKRKLATSFDFFVYFVNEKDEVLNVKGVCGTGHPLINTTHNIKSAYYYSEDTDKFLKDFMNQTFAADIYFGDNPSDLNDIDALIINLGKYQLLVMEHPNLPTSIYSEYKDELENYTSYGNYFMISGELTSAQGKELVGADFFKKLGQSESQRTAIVNNTDQYLALSVGQSMVFNQYYYVENKSSSSQYSIIATFNQTGDNAISKWRYGNGTVYFFSDFETSFFNGNFIDKIEGAIESFIEGTCNPINLTAISPKYLAKTERYLIYNSKPAKMLLYVWQ